MTQPEPQAVDEMFNEVLHTEDDVLVTARQSAVTAGMPAIEVSAQHGKLLSLLATISGATRVLEIGTLAGYSTINLARGVGAAGRVTTLEYDARHADIARANFEAAGIAVLDCCEFGHFDESTAQVARQRSALLTVAAGDGHHQQAGDGALLQLVDQHLLLGARPGGQKKRHVGAKAAVPDDGGASQHGEQPEQ